MSQHTLAHARGRRARAAASMLLAVRLVRHAAHRRGRQSWIAWPGLVLASGCFGGEAIPLPPRPEAPADNLSAELTIHDPLPGSPVQSLALGIDFTCALLSGGGVKCWGSDADGVLGLAGAPRTVSDPSLIGLVDFATERSVVQISAGWHHACVLFDDGHARCWGRNESGQLGRGNTQTYGDDPGESLGVLEDLPLDHVMAISAGVSNTCALVRAGDPADHAGTVHCWGSDGEGGLGDAQSGDFGDDEVIDALRPVTLSDRATLIETGERLGCARLLDGEVHCWGSNAFGTLGIGDTACNIGDERLCQGSQDRPAEREVRGLSGHFIADLKVNQANACAVDNYGQLFCWGRNDQSRAGYPEATYGSTLAQPPGPVRLGEIQVEQVALGVRHGCALDTTGQIRCWGEAGPQLGYGLAQMDGLAGIGGTREPREQYAAMPNGGGVALGTREGQRGSARALRLFSGGYHNCAIIDPGSVRCWGHNESGQLGYGDYSQIGNIGDDGSPDVEYERLGRYDVCVLPDAAGACGR